MVLSLSNPTKVTWQALSVTRDVAWSTTEEYLSYIWRSDLVLDVCKLAAGLDSWNISTLETQGDKGLANLNHVPEAAWECGA